MAEAPRRFRFVAETSRARAYAILLLGAVLAGICGAALDQLTVTLSPEYFLEGKALSGAPSLRVAVAWMGFRAGLPFGALVAGAGVLAARHASAFSWTRWIQSVATGIGVALLVAPAAMLLADPFGVRAAASRYELCDTSDRFLACWGLHLGTYVGVIGGVVLAVWRAGTGRAAASLKTQR